MKTPTSFLRGRYVSPLAALLSLAGALASPGLRAAELPARERVGFELTPLALNAGEVDTASHSLRVENPPRYALGLGLDVRLFRQSHPEAGMYWNPVALGFFWGGARGAPTVLVQARTEIGAVLQPGGLPVEIAVGAGLGTLGVTYADTECDAPCNLGGTGFVVSPVVRVLGTGVGSVSLGGFLRMVVPAYVLAHHPGYTTGRAALFLMGLDIRLLSPQ